MSTCIPGEQQSEGSPCATLGKPPHSETAEREEKEDQGENKAHSMHLSSATWEETVPVSKTLGQPPGGPRTLVTQ